MFFSVSSRIAESVAAVKTFVAFSISESVMYSVSVKSLRHD